LLSTVRSSTKKPVPYVRFPSARVTVRRPTPRGHLDAALEPTNVHQCGVLAEQPLELFARRCGVFHRRRLVVVRRSHGLVARELVDAFPDAWHRFRGTFDDSAQFVIAGHAVIAGESEHVEPKLGGGLLEADRESAPRAECRWSVPLVASRIVGPRRQRPLGAGDCARLPSLKRAGARLFRGLRAMCQGWHMASAYSVGGSGHLHRAVDHRLRLPGPWFRRVLRGPVSVCADSGSCEHVWGGWRWHMGSVRRRMTICFI
jgi:hypothetical protein